jgi:hypothetical protein
MKISFLIAVLLLLSSTLLAQNVPKKGDMIIHLTGHDAWVDHKFFVDIYKKGNSAKIVFAYHDSIRYSELRKDTEYNRVNNNLTHYKPDDGRRNAIMDTIGMIFERHSTYTRDSLTFNLKTDTIYKNLLLRLAKANKVELAPKIDQRALDGWNIFLKVITEDNNLYIVVPMPILKTHPLLVNFIKSTLDKNKNGNAVKKIRKYYVEY